MMTRAIQQSRQTEQTLGQERAELEARLASVCETSCDVLGLYSSSDSQTLDDFPLPLNPPSLFFPLVSLGCLYCYATPHSADMAVSIP